MRNILWLLVAFLCCSARSRADDINLSHLTVKEGLLNSTVYFAMQDSKGFIWFCTETGVSRYDGRNFENFTISEGLADNIIFKCYEDSKNRIWFLSYNGKLSYYNNGRIFNSENTPSLSYPVSGAFLLQCMEDRSGNLWFSTSFNNVISVNDSGVKQYKSLYAGRSHGDRSLWALLFSRDDSVYKFTVNSTQDLFLENLNSGRAAYLTRYPEIQQHARQPVTNRFCDPKGILFIDDNDLGCFDSSGNLYLFDLSVYGVKSKPLSVMLDGQYLWIATEAEGVMKIDLGTGRVVLNILKGDLVTRIMKDKEQDIWFVTHDDGIYIFKSNSQRFNTLNTGITFSVCNISSGSGHVLLAGSNNGRITIIRDNKEEKSIRLSGRELDRALDLIPVDSDRVLIGSDDGLYEYDLNTAQKTDRGTCLHGYKNFDRGPGGNTWFCSQDKIVRVKDGNCTQISWEAMLVKFTAIAVVSDSVYYAGTTNKLYKGHDGSPLELLLDDKVLKTQVTGLRIVKDALWVATHGNGIFILKDDKVVKHLTKAGDDIVSDICQKMYDDGDRYVWIATNEGISALDRNNYSLVTNINADVGLSSNDIKNIVVDKERVYAATSAGVCIFKIADMLYRNFPPEVYVTGFKKGNKKIIDPGDKISFDHFMGSITVSFTAITFQSSQSMKYEYKFAEESEWHPTLASDLSFFSLRPGTHSLMFRARKYNSDWSKPVLLSIVVVPLWYQTSWFQFSVAFVLLLAAYFIIQERLRTVRKKDKEKHEYDQKLVELENKALISQMNPHFIFNSLNTVQQLILVKEEQLSLDYLSDLSTLMRKMLENSRKQYITLAEEIEFLNRYMELEAIRFNNKFSYSLAVDEQLATSDIKIPPVLLQPLLENAIKHGISTANANGKITLSITRQDNYLVFVIEDNGIGIEVHRHTYVRSRAGQSTGLKVLEERLKLIRNSRGEASTIEITDKGDDETGSGTLIRLQIPIQT